MLEHCSPELLRTIEKEGEYGELRENHRERRRVWRTWQTFKSEAGASGSLLKCGPPMNHSPAEPSKSLRTLLLRGGSISTLASHQGKPGSIPGRVTGLSLVGIVPDEAVGRRVFSGISRFSHSSFRHRFIFTSITLISSQDLTVKSRPNLFIFMEHCPVRAPGCGGGLAQLHIGVTCGIVSHVRYILHLIKRFVVAGEARDPLTLLTLSHGPVYTHHTLTREQAYFSTPGAFITELINPLVKVWNYFPSIITNFNGRMSLSAAFNNVVHVPVLLVEDAGSEMTVARGLIYLCGLVGGACLGPWHGGASNSTRPHERIHHNSRVLLCKLVLAQCCTHSVHAVTRKEPGEAENTYCGHSRESGEAHITRSSSNGSNKGDSVTHIKCAIASKSKVLNYRVVFSSHRTQRPRWCGGQTTLGKPGSITGEVIPGFLHVGIVPDDATGRRVFSGISRFPCPCIPAPLHTNLTSPSSALKTSMLEDAQISPRHSSRRRGHCIIFADEEDAACPRYKCILVGNPQSWQHWLRHTARWKHWFENTPQSWRRALIPLLAYYYTPVDFLCYNRKPNKFLSREYCVYVSGIGKVLNGREEPVSVGTIACVTLELYQWDL
ncbi:hypothetical protein PR048_030953 [Dryococelus australis]|uniref:Uncharacterized protein n=1 Tax=Dryococelus australis TaxID=614101 RepID=A0ABQ9GAC4_9NEOP|nr:hypothetical protein PR048_030953 [Dryococelus australis]